MKAGELVRWETTLPAGIYTITAVYSGDSGFATSSSAAIGVSIRTPQYDISGAPTALTVTAPGSVSGSFNIVPISGYIGGIDMSCSGLPANTQCVFLPAVVQFNGSTNTPQPVTLTIRTNTPAATTVAAWMLPLSGLLLLGVSQAQAAWDAAFPAVGRCSPALRGRGTLHQRLRFQRWK